MGPPEEVDCMFCSAKLHEHYSRKWPGRSTAELGRLVSEAGARIMSTAVEIPQLLSTQQCELLIRAANRRAEAVGWGVGSHSNHSTTDVKVRDLGEDALEVFRRRVEAPLRSCVAEAFGVSVRTHDAFIVHYSRAGKAELGLHRDGSVVSATVSLSAGGDYEGGGTRIDEAVFRPERGGALLFPGQRLHGAARTTRGSRYILAVFFALSA